MRKPKIVKNRYNTRICGIGRVRTANMVYQGVVFGTISEERNDAGETDWVIKIDWKAWEEVGKPLVAGIDLDLRLDEYIRTFVPAFVEQRTLPDNRVNLKEELERFGLKTNDRFEFMCRNHGRCGNDRITVERIEGED